MMHTDIYLLSGTCKLMLKEILDFHYCKYHNSYQGRGNGLGGGVTCKD